MNNPTQTISQVIKGWSMRGGIYEITCTRTQRTYLGSTQNIIKRLKQHHTQLAKNQHKNEAMQQDFNLWGENSFVVQFIKLVPSYYNRKQLYLDEQNYLDVVKSFADQYYNKSHKCKESEPKLPKAVQSFIRKHVDPYHCARLTCDTFEVKGKIKTVLAYQFQDQIMHYHTIEH